MDSPRNRGRYRLLPGIFARGIENDDAAGWTRDDQRIEDEVDVDPLHADVGLVGNFRIDRQQEVAVLVADGVTAEINHGCDAPAQLLGERADRGLHLRASGVLRIDHVETAFAQNIGEGAGIAGCRSDRRLWIGAVADHKRYPLWVRRCVPWPKAVAFAISDISSARPPAHQHRHRPGCVAPSQTSLSG